MRKKTAKHVKLSLTSTRFMWQTNIVREQSYGEEGKNRLRKLLTIFISIIGSCLYRLCHCGMPVVFLCCQQKNNNCSLITMNESTMGRHNPRLMLHSRSEWERESLNKHVKVESLRINLSGGVACSICSQHKRERLHTLCCLTFMLSLKFKRTFSHDYNLNRGRLALF